MGIKQGWDFAEWTGFIPESEIRRLLRYNVTYYFAGGKPGVIPTDIFAKILIELGNEQLNNLQTGKENLVIDDYNYGPTGGKKWFLETLASRLKERDHVPLGSDGWSKVTLTSGSQQALYAILDTLIDPGDIILTPSPAYLGFLVPAVKLRSNIVTIPTDLEGIVPEYLEKAIEKSIARWNKTPDIIYIVPDSDNPKGTTLPLSRRKALFDIAEKYDILIIEDAAYKEIQFKGERIPPIKSFDKNNERVAYLSSTSKEAAVFRVGYSVLPDALREEVLKDKGYLDLCTSTILQKILNIYYRDYFDKVIDKVRNEYRKRYEAMSKAMDETFPPGVRTDPSGGFFIWWESDKPFDSSKFLEDVALPNDILYVPGRAFYPLNGYAYDPDKNDIIQGHYSTNCMRLGYSYLKEDLIDKGIRRLGALLSKEIK